MRIEDLLHAALLADLEPHCPCVGGRIGVPGDAQTPPAPTNPVEGDQCD